MQSSHQSALEFKHAALDQRLEQEIHRPAPDSIVIAELKKRKLRLKQEMAQP
ncbi:YdcH family protein [uncultured Sphingomonas sp.]|uniref:YdcH family protein n=1 Tax=uncultured Sphingomonas sp. TaxID=158754 RepID=UPI0035CB4E0A